MSSTVGEVFLVKTTDRSRGVEALMNRFNLKSFAKKHVALKANFNSADPFPASTHLSTLQAIVEILKKADVAQISLGERSGMGDTRKVLGDMGVLGLSEKLGFDAVVLDEIGKEEWIEYGREGTHWLRGFCIAKLFNMADKVVQTCCLKAHRFGGHFTLSLKNSVGLVAKRLPGGFYDYMWELHASPFQRHMIAEVNLKYKPDVVVMDGIRAFVDGGPDRGTEVEPNLMLASGDRVALDAVGVAILRSYNTTRNIMKGRIFELDQLRRASELRIGVTEASQIKIIPLDEETEVASKKLQAILERQG